LMAEVKKKLENSWSIVKNKVGFNLTLEAMI
jgi:hypothetical protein